LIKFGPSGSNPRNKVQSLEPIRESDQFKTVNRAKLEPLTQSKENIYPQEMLEERLAMAKSIDMLEKTANFGPKTKNKAFV
jgi:hypothetical protein